MAVSVSIKIRYIDNSSTQTSWVAAQTTDLTILDENYNEITWTPSGSYFQFTVSSLPAVLFFKRADDTVPRIGNKTYIHNLTSAEVSDREFIIYEADKEEGHIWQGAKEVLEVYQGETCVYKQKKPKKYYFTLYTPMSGAPSGLSVSINGSTGYRSVTTIDGIMVTSYTYPCVDGLPSTTYAGTTISYEVKAPNYVTETSTFALRRDTSALVQLQQGEDARTLQIITDPLFADVYFNGTYDSDKKIIVTYNTSVNWEVRGIGYNTSSGEILVTENTSLYVPLSQELADVTFVGSPSNPKIEIMSTNTGTWTEITGNTVQLPMYNSYYYRISKDGYKTYETATPELFVSSNPMTVSYNLDIDVSTYDVDFIITPSSGNTINVNGTNLSSTRYTGIENETINWTVINSNAKYETASGSFTLTQDTSIVRTLATKQVTFTIVPTPDTANVSINGAVRANKSVTVDYGTNITYRVYASGYGDVSDTYANLVDNVTLQISLDQDMATVIVRPVPSDACVYFNNTLTSSKSISVQKGSTLPWRVTYDVGTNGAAGYESSSNIYTVTNSATQYIDVSMTPKLCEVIATISPAEAASNTSIWLNNVYESDNETWVYYDSSITYKAENLDYNTQTGEVKVNDNPMYIPINMGNIIQIPVKFTLRPKDCEFYINRELIENVVDGSVTIYVDKYSDLEYDAICDPSYEAQYGIRITNIIDPWVENVSLFWKNNTITFNWQNPSTGSISVNGNTISGTTYTAPYGSQINYTATANGYTDQNGGPFTLLQNATINLYLPQISYTVTIVPDPGNADVSINGATRSSIAGLRYGDTINYEVSASGYTTKRESYTVAGNNPNITLHVGLDVYQSTLTFYVTPNDAAENIHLYADVHDVSLSYVSGATYATGVYTGNLGESVDVYTEAENYNGTINTYQLPDYDGGNRDVSITLTPKYYDIYATILDADTMQPPTRDASIDYSFKADGSDTSVTGSLIGKYNHTKIASSAYKSKYRFQYIVPGYQMTIDSGTVNKDTSIYAIWSAATYTLTITTTPSSAKVKFNGVLYPSKSISGIKYGETVDVYVYDESGNYNPYQKNITVYSSGPHPITLSAKTTYKRLTFTKADPTNAVIKYDIGDTNNFNPTNIRTLSGTTLDVPEGKYVYWRAEAASASDLYVPSTPEYVYMDADTPKTVDLVHWPGIRFVISPDDASDATKIVTGDYSGEIDPIDGVYYEYSGYNVDYYIFKTNYEPSTGSYMMPDNSESVVPIPITLVPETSKKQITFNVSPWNCNVTATAYKSGGGTESLAITRVSETQFTCQIDSGDNLSFAISKDGWTTYSMNPVGNTITTNKSYDINLNCEASTPFSIECHTDGTITPIITTSGLGDYRYLDISIYDASMNFVSSGLTRFAPSGTSGTTITVNKGETVRIHRSNVNQVLDISTLSSNNYYCYFAFTSTGNSAGDGGFHAYGNILSLISCDGFTTSNYGLGDYAFYRLFYNQTLLKTSRQLLLRTSVPANYAFYEMFRGCTGLTNGMVVMSQPNNSASYAYMCGNMYYGCTSLTVAPNITITIPQSNCCYQMFYNCTNLDYVRCNFKDIAPSSSYTSNWLYGVKSTGTFKKLATATWANPSRSASTIPNNWTITTTD